MVILTKWFRSHLDEVQVEVRSSQVKLCLILCWVFSNTIGVCIIQFWWQIQLLYFYFCRWSTTSKKWNSILCDMYFLHFFGNSVTKNWRIASHFGMGIANAVVHNIYPAFLNKKKMFFIFSKTFSFKEYLQILKIRNRHFLALVAWHSCCFLCDLLEKSNFGKLFIIQTILTKNGL